MSATATTITSLHRPSATFRSRTQSRPRLSQVIIRAFLRIVPARTKIFLYQVAARVSSRWGHQPYHNIFRLPFGLVLKISSNPHAVEASALRFVASLRGINAPALIGCVATAEKTFLLSTWIDGDCCADIWEQLTPPDKNRLVARLRQLFREMRAQTATQNHVLCSGAGGAILDPRVPWLEDEPRVFSSTQDFLEQVWPGLDSARNRETLRPKIRPLIQRADVPIVFCHGDTLPKNVLLPGGLEPWRKGRSTVCLIDWEYAGWMPLPWDALKATWLCCEPEDEWLAMMKGVFPESGAELEADWEWRLLSNVTIL